MRAVKDTGKLQLLLASLLLLIIALGIVVLVHGVEESPYKEEKTTHYRSKSLGVKVTYPEAWDTHKVEDNHFRGPGILLRIRPHTGNPADVDGVCEQEAITKPELYGNSPTVQFTRIDGQRGCVIHGGVGAEQSAILFKTQREIYAYDKAYRYIIIETTREDVNAVSESTELYG